MFSLGLVIMIIDKMIVGMHSWPWSGRGAVILRNPNEIMKIVHTDVQYAVKVDLIQIISLAVYVYILLVLR